MPRFVPRLILTRPEPENQAWMEALQATGFQVVAWPLIDIESLGSHPDLKQAWVDLPIFRAAMFVSRAAVLHFFAQRPKDAAWPQQTRVWCTGPGTRKALTAQGIPQACIDAPPADGPWDTEHLWPVVQGQVRAQDTILLVRGTDASVSPVANPSAGLLSGVGRDWLAQQVLNQNAQIRGVVAYRRACPRWSLERTQQAQIAAEDGSVWVFSSAQALSHLSQLLPGLGWHQAKAVATHPRIAQKAREMGFGQVLTCPPTPQALTASLESQP